MFKKRSLLSKFWLKHSNTGEYQDYKWALRNYNAMQNGQSLIDSKRLSNLNGIKQLGREGRSLNISHSGNAGDIIYALATVKKIAELTGSGINFYLRLNTPMDVPKYFNHPLGNVMLNQKMADMLLPLLRRQLYISSCEVYSNENIDIDLDYFREGLVNLNKGNIARWCGYITGINPDLYLPWLNVEPDTAYQNTILLARSHRYRNPLISHTFLNQYPDIKFIGVAAEYEDMKKQIPQLEWLQVADFGQLARVISGCKFFIGNQSFPFSLAEALKVPRILEANYEVVNVVPEGPFAYDFLFQPHFESLVEQLYQGEVL